jgi:hypothetical protein
MIDMVPKAIMLNLVRCVELPDFHSPHPSPEFVY